ncbi:site-2 protease family protein [Nocardioides sp. BP30]|uniref:M50 family metallopeptidase n=1 Tax=Nocardioides sp. BP30 TaxID=3036374 RepID=UPI00246956E1|nr:site-2 protease family protein [Nocardioides sp. BP30]WGL53747.1 site-2 protease family protein [Nocardioides sp. BP30]
MTAVFYLLGVVLFVAAILASIGLHELGHMIPAKAFGAKVTQYFIGFGPTVWSKKKGETEYGVKGVPLGGYVKIVGMLPPGPGQGQAHARQADAATSRSGLSAGSVAGSRTGSAGSAAGAATGEVMVRRSNTGMFTQLISDARAAEWETIQPEDAPRLFYRLAWWKKVIVMAGGPTVNLLIAFFVFLGVFGIYGSHEVVADGGPPVIDSVSKCVIPYAESGRACRSTDPVAPAYQAGLRPGDRVTSFNGTAVTDWAQLRTLIQHNLSGHAVIGYTRDGTAMTGQTTTTVEARPSSDDPDDQTLKQVGFLGVSPASHIQVTHGGPIYTLRQMGTMTKDSVVSLVHLPVRVWGVAEAIVGVKERAADSPVSIVGGGRIAGEEISAKGFPLGDKIAGLLMLVGGFNLFIGLFNFIPLLPLDGGHIASALWEAVRRGFARLRRRPDPGYVDAAKLLPVAYVVASFLLVMGVVLIIGDLVVPLHPLSQ